MNQVLPAVVVDDAPYGSPFLPGGAKVSSGRRGFFRRIPSWLSAMLATATKEERRGNQD